jgi:plasmid stability protein
MAAVTIRNLSDETHRALKVRAKQHGRSTEAEIRAILDEAVLPAERVHLAEELAALGRRIGLRDEDLTYFERDKTPTEPISFE